MSVASRFDGGVFDRFYKKAGARMEPCFVVPDQDSGARIKGALRREGGNGGLMLGSVRLLHLHLTAMHTIAAATDWQVRV